MTTTDAASLPAAREAAARPAANSALRHHYAVIAVGALVLLASFVLRVDAPDRVYFPGARAVPAPQICAWKNVTGLDCPGCGLTRSFISVGHADWLSAWRHHRLGIAAYALLLAWIGASLLSALRLRRGQPALATRWLRYAVIALGVALPANWAWKMWTTFG